MPTDADALRRASPTVRSVLVVDDHVSLGEAVAAALRQDRGIGNVMTRASMADALAVLQRQQVDVVLLDVHLSGEDGITSISLIKATAPAAHIVVFTGASDRATLARAMAAGANGFVSKSSPMQEVTAAVLAATTAAVVISRGDVARLTHEIVPAQRITGGLSERELDVLVHLEQGMAAAEIASTLYLSVHTCRDHLKSVYKKLGVNSQLQAVAEARRRGIL